MVTTAKGTGKQAKEGQRGLGDEEQERTILPLATCTCAILEGALLDPYFVPYTGPVLMTYLVGKDLSRGHVDRRAQQPSSAYMGMCSYRQCMCTRACTPAVTCAGLAEPLGAGSCWCQEELAGSSLQAPYHRSPFPWMLKP